MPTEKNVYKEDFSGCKKAHKALVASAIDALVSSGLATVDAENWSCPLLRLATGEIFLLGEDSISRIQ